ncbi:MAG: hypothetical protein WA581_00645 [Candidatus Acidiferrales bacterium]
MEEAQGGREAAQTARPEEISTLLHDARADIVLGLLDNPHFDENHLCLLLGRKDLSTALLDEIAGRHQWLANYPVRRALAYHPHVPAALGLRLVRELFLADLVQLALLPSGSPPVKHLAEELVLARLPQLPPAQKMILARRGSVRITGALLADGQPEIVSIVLESPFLNEGQVLKALSKITVPARVVAAIAESGRWSQHYSVRLALLRNPQAPLARVLSFLPGISTADLRILAESSSVPASLRPHIRRELANHTQRGTGPARRYSKYPKLT